MEVYPSNNYLPICIVQGGTPVVAITQIREGSFGVVIWSQ